VKAEVAVDGEPVNDPQTNHHTLDLDVPVPNRAASATTVSTRSGRGIEGTISLAPSVLERTPLTRIALGARLGTKLLEGNLLEIYVEGDNLGDVRYEEVPGVPLPRRTVAAGLRLAW
jgi:hypothetical protein